MINNATTTTFTPKLDFSMNFNQILKNEEEEAMLCSVPLDATDAGLPLPT